MRVGGEDLPCNNEGPCLRRRQASDKCSATHLGRACNLTAAWAEDSNPRAGRTHRFCEEQSHGWGDRLQNGLRRRVGLHKLGMGQCHLGEESRGERKRDER